jgi:AcrR family transcriptional regulator
VFSPVEAEQGGAGEAGERERIVEAMVDLVLEHGYPAVSVAAVIERASLPAGAFERHFTSLQEAVLETYDEYNDAFDRQVRSAYAGPGTWRERLRAAAYAAADFLAARPREVRFNVIAVLSAGEMLAARRDRYLQGLVQLVDDGRRDLDDPDSVTRAVAEGAVGAIFERLLRDVNRGGGLVSPRSVVPELMYVAVRPYLGPEAAREELSIPPPPIRRET